ncbi:hypothetical protein RND71_018249 [Anisodus tanguticus]|uniref:Uncharacterized protein n=1 Tax=Anisodus tanguticus TaxID=243964 RepID=A0AAE1VAS9_9SOLA|nr:hypothetical protein RND71_018249 [Anisodus tanguticus]
MSNSGDDFTALESNFPSLELEDKKLNEEFDKCENSSNDFKDFVKLENSIIDFPALKSILPSIETNDEKSYEDFDKCENNSNDDFPPLVSKRE